MSIRKKFFITFVAILLLFALVNEFTSASYGLRKMKEEWSEQNRINLRTVLDLQKQSVRAMALELANDPSVIRAYRENNPQLIIDDKLPFWKKVKEENLVYEIHFFKPPAVSFVNFSNFESIGSDVHRVRKDIVWITSSFRHSSHLMMCKTYAGVRATYPIVDTDGKMLGGISLGKKVDWIPSVLKRLTGKEAFLVYTESSAKSLADEYYKAFVRDKTKVGEYIFAERTLPISEATMGKIDFGKPMQRVQVNGTTYILNTYPLKEFSGNIMAYVGVLNDAGLFYEQFTDRVLKDLLILAGVGFLIFLITQNYMDRMLERIAAMRSLTQHLKENRFEALDRHDLEALQAKDDRDEIVGLQLNILEMGHALQAYQNTLESHVNEKTRALFEANRRLEHQLYSDVLTGLPNRNAFFRDIEAWEATATALIDITGFKRINDLYGIEVGNELLQAVADFFDTRGSEAGAAVYRFGSDEFALVPQNGTEGFERAVSRLVEEAESVAFIVGEEQTGIYIDLAAGISFEKDYLVETADLALHEAQQKHQNCLVYSVDMGLYETNEESIALTKSIKNAIAEDRFILHFQPIVNADGALRKHETLVRMIEGDRVLSPYHFLEFAKNTRYYKAISQIVLQKSFETFGSCNCHFSVNITADDIIDEETVGLIKALLEKLPGRERVVFEIVETESILNFEAVQHFVDEVRGLGAKIAIDDFGSGYSNFSYILKLAPDYLKIDGSLVRHIHEDTNALAIVTTIVGFAKALKIRTIAEFVHCREVFEVCRSLGIDEFQGYYISKPLEEPLIGTNTLDLGTPHS
jgi:diguanylate cyclase (GGDEF)-like protein